MEQKINVLAFYHFGTIEDPQSEVISWKKFLDTCDMSSRIYISHDGINGQMSIAAGDTQRFIDWVHSDARFSTIEFKVHTYLEHVFPKRTIKFRKKLVAIEEQIDRSLNGEYLTPEQWKEKLAAKDPSTMLIDVRNDYEWDVGHFEGSQRPQMRTFREFSAYADKLAAEVDKEQTSVLMCCTGGIRCELFAPMLKKRGFKHVYQLKGGIIKYGLEQGHDHWKGKLFVFDDRLVVPIDPQNTESIGKCHFCSVETSTYYNCANMDCNELYLACPACAAAMKGCCCAACNAAPRVRAFESKEHVKPFRKLSKDEKQKFVDNDS